MDASGYGMGLRGKRFAVVVKDGVTHASQHRKDPVNSRVLECEHVLGQLLRK